MKIGLALSGGGARGIAHIEFLKMFDDLNIKPSIISGTSMGAAIGALYASGLTGQEIENLMKKLTIKQLTGFVGTHLTKKGGILETEKLIEYFKKITKTDSFSKLKIPLKIVATDFWKRKQIVFEKGKISNAIQASISIPGIFEPAKIRNNVFVDGGIVNPVPYDIIRKDCDILIAVDVCEDKSNNNKKHAPNIFEGVYSSLIISQKFILENKMNNFKPDIYIRPDLTKIGLFQFHKVEKIIRLTNNTALKLKMELKKLIDSGKLKQIKTN